MSHERRMTRGGSKIEVREAKGSAGVLVGHGAVFYDPNDETTRYLLWDDVEERVAPGAFDRAIREKQDVRALFNHDVNHVLGRTGPGTMRLSVDAKGLRYEIDTPETQSGRDVVTVVRRGDVSGSSFSFRTVKDTVTRETRNGRPYYIRTLEDVDLYDVGPVTFPAYEGADAGARAAIVARAVGGDPAAEAARIRQAADSDDEARADARRRRIEVARRS
jgi:hypothetical protein